MLPEHSVHIEVVTNLPTQRVTYRLGKLSVLDDQLSASDDRSHQGSESARCGA